jgi:hypothetical protein
MSPRILAGLLVVLLGLEAATAHAEDPQEGVEIVIATVSSKRAARRAVVRAAVALGQRAAPETTYQVPARNRHAGPIVSAHAAGPGKIAIVASLGGQSSAPERLLDARRIYPGARAVPAWLPPEELELVGESVPARFIIVASSHSRAAARRAARRFRERSAYPHLDTVVERSDDYEGLTPNLYVAIAGFFLRGEEGAADARLREAREYAPDAYLAPTLFNPGCMH